MSILLELRSTNHQLALYGDHLELKNVLGSKKENIPYSQIRGVALNRTSTLAKIAAAYFTVGMSLAVTNKKTLIIDTGPMNLKLDFRAWPLSKLNKAVDIISKGILRGSQTNATGNNIASTMTRDLTDELTKLADLKDKGILIDAEFQEQKIRLLRQ